MSVTKMKCYKCNNVVKWGKLFSFKLGQMEVRCDFCNTEIIKKEELLFSKILGSLLVVFYLVLIKLFDFSLAKELCLILFLVSFFIIFYSIIFTRRLTK